MADTFAAQSFARLTAALEQALVKGALKGDRVVMEDLRRELTAIRLEVTAPQPPPAPFRGKRQLVFEALLSGCNQREAARKSGCTDQTVHRWVKKDPVFMAELDKARAERMQSAKEGVADLLPLAVRRLRGVLLDPAAQHRDVIAAVREVMDRTGMVKPDASARAAGSATAGNGADSMDIATMDRATFLRRQLADLETIVRTVDPRYPSRIQAVRASGEIHAALAAIADEGKEKPDAATLSPEQWGQRVLDDAKAATVEDLELYVVEWLDRHRLDMAVEQGTPVIRRRSA